MEILTPFFLFLLASTFGLGVCAGIVLAAFLKGTDHE
jgi:hypothetical protein